MKLLPNILWIIPFIDMVFLKAGGNSLEPSTKASNGEPSTHINGSLSPDAVGVLGKEIRLACYVVNLGNKTVSWIRHRDIHLLTAGLYTYTYENRFSAYHLPYTNYWQLRIRNLTHGDEGKYECQVSTTPPMGHQIMLKIVEPQTEILGGPDMFINRGSTINLTCVSKFSPAPPPDVIWYHNEEVIAYDSPRGGVSVVTEKGDITTSHLLIQRAMSADSGIYRCVPINSVEASLNLHILAGKNPDAWQTVSLSSASQTQFIPSFLRCLFVFLPLILQSSCQWTSL